MTITQTVEIPASRRISLDLPLDLPIGMAKITVYPNTNEHIVTIEFDEEAQKWYAQNDDIPILLEDASLDKLINRVRLAAPEMLEINNIPCSEVKLSFKIETQMVKAYQ